VDGGAGRVGFGWRDGGENQEDQEGTQRGGGGCRGEKEKNIVSLVLWLQIST